MWQPTAVIKMINEFENALKNTIEEKGSLVKEAMNYSLLAGGKRIRPMILLSLLEDLTHDYKYGISSAIALEMIHTYSLVHDDLPAMDNDDFRRHKPTNHKVYGEGMAILAGDGLLNDAFLTILKGNYPADVAVSLIEILGRNAGPEGMILGQEIDIQNKFETLDELTHSYQLKTGCLFAVAFESALVLANKPELQAKGRQLGYNLGIYFQYQDDILEYTSDFESMGKNLESDEDRDKHTIVTFLGLDEAIKTADKLFESIQKDILELSDSRKCYELIQDMQKRKN